MSTRVGYSGGDAPNATYRNRETHAEAIEIIFNPYRTTYRGVCTGFSSRSMIRRRSTARETALDHERRRYAN
jgi:hypothetical protein